MTRYKWVNAMRDCYTIACLHPSSVRSASVALTAMIPAMTTGTIHFIIKSGRNTPMAAIPTPDFDVPYDAPMPLRGNSGAEGIVSE